MRLKSLLIILSVILVAFLLTSCGEKAECKKKSDCKALNTCFTVSCVDGKCVQKAKDNCCGNAKCEADFGETSCTCTDCGNCSAKGKVKYNVTTRTGSKRIEATYARYVCDGDLCVVGVAPEDVVEKRLTSLIDERGGFKAEVLTTMNYPFDTRKDVASIRIYLKDLDPDVVGGIVIKRIQVLDGSEVMGEELLSQELASVDESFIQDAPLRSSQIVVEETKTIDIVTDYEYVVIERGAYVTKRNYAKNRLTEKILFISE